MSFKNVIVTGANRGIGLEFIKQLVKQNPPIKNLIATTRKQSSDLDELKSSNPNIHILNYDATKYEELDNFANEIGKIVQDDGVDLLINNAGILVRGDLKSVTHESILTNMNVNVCAPLMLTKALLPLLKKSVSNGNKTIVANITSRIGSIEDNQSGGIYPYRISKVALNMVGKSMAIDLKEEKIIILSLHPGWVRTDMGGPNAKIDTVTSVTGMLESINNKGMESSGAFLDYNGGIIPW